MHAPLTYELEKLEVIMKSLLFPSQYSQPALFEYDGKLKETFSQEIEAIKKSFIREVFSFSEEQHLQRYIHFHQQELIRILDSLHLLFRQSPAQPGLSVANLHLVLRTMDDLLGFIEIHFTRYFNQDTKAPESYIASVGSETILHLSSFQEWLRKHDTAVQLITLLLSPLRKIIERIPSKKITYREIICVKEITRQLRKRLEDAPTAGINGDQVRFLFLFLNYNTLVYFDHYTHYLAEVIKAIDGIPQKMEKLSFLLKEIRQVQLIHSISLNYLKPSLKEQLIDWISEEMAHLEKSLQLAQKNPPMTSALSADFKMQTDLSLSQLAYLLRIFVDRKTIQNKNLSEVLRFISHAFQVKGQNISFESFRVRYYNPEESIRKSVRSFLLELVDLINKS